MNARRYKHFKVTTTSIESPFKYVHIYRFNIFPWHTNSLTKPNAAINLVNTSKRSVFFRYGNRMLNRKYFFYLAVCKIAYKSYYSLPNVALVSVP